jgi:tetratricopeptide (TPR) repeat protein
MVVYDLASAYRSLPSTKAIQLLEQERDRQVATLGSDHPDTLKTLFHLAFNLIAQRRRDEGIRLYEQVSHRQTAVLGPDHPATLTTLHELAMAYSGAGRHDEAIRLYEQVRDRRSATLGPNHSATLTTMNNLGIAYRRAGRSTDAVRILEAARDGYAATFGPNHRSTHNTLQGLAIAYGDAGRTADAVLANEQLLERRIAMLGPKHRATLMVLNNLAGAYYADNRMAQYGQALERMLATLPAYDPRVYDPLRDWALARLGKLRFQAGRPSDAEPLLRECLAIRETSEKLQRNEVGTFNARSLLGKALLDQQKYAEAEPLLLQGYEGLKQREAKIPATTLVRLTEALEWLVQLYEATDRSAEAAKWRKELDETKAAAKTPVKP